MPGLSWSSAMDAPLRSIPFNHPTLFIESPRRGLLGNWRGPNRVTSTKGELVTHSLIRMGYILLVSINNRRRRNAQMLQQIIESVIREDTTEQLDSTFEGIARAVSLRSAQGLGTDESLNEMLAEITAERNTRPAASG